MPDESAHVPRICMVTLRSPFMVPPVMHQATVLGEAGYEVDLLHLAGPTPERASTHDGSSLRGENVHPVCVGVKRTRQTSAFNYVRMLGHARRMAKRRQYDAFWGYDYFGFYVAHRLARSHPTARLVYHQNELFEPNRLRFGARSLFNQHLKSVGDADVVIIPDKNRAAYFVRQTTLQTEPIIVGNYPLRLEPTALPQRVPSLIAPYFHDPQPAHVVVYIGWFSVHSGVDTTIKSMPHWPRDTGFLIIGEPGTKGRREIDRLATSVGCGGRVSVTGYLPKSRELLVLTSSCHLGVAPYQQSTGSTGVLLSSTSSNKVFEYMQAGLPVVASDLPGYRRIVEGERIGQCVDAEEPEILGRAVSDILSDGPEHDAMSARAWDAYVTRYNYQVEFKPVLDRLQELIPR